MLCCSESTLKDKNIVDFFVVFVFDLSWTINPAWLRLQWYVKNEVIYDITLETS